MLKFLIKLLKFSLYLIVIAALIILGSYVYLRNQLPDVDSLNNVHLSEPLKVYDQNGVMLGEFGERKRIFVPFKDIPQTLKDAVIAVEDRRFYEHSGIDPIGIVRAGIAVIKSGKRIQGASTLTQQVARNFYLSNEKTFTRKIKEIILALEIEKDMSKDQILELYLNNSFLGNRSYGVAAAAKTYFNKDLKQLTLSEMALLAGLNQSPSTANPIRSIEKATIRRNQVLQAMLNNGYITREMYEQSKEEPIVVDQGPLISRVGAYAAEIARAELVRHYGEDVYSSGYKVYTTIDYKLQLTAEHALRQQLIDYDHRHGWNGPTARLWKSGETPLTKEQIIKRVSGYYDYGIIKPIGIINVTSKSAIAVDAYGQEYNLDINAVKWASRFINDNKVGPEPKKVSNVLTNGDLVYLQTIIDSKTQKVSYKIADIPEVNGGLISIDSLDGAIKTMVGGFSFQVSPFNRVFQSLVQVGSVIKPFVYSSALDNKGYTWGSVINDSEITLKVGKEVWQPRNYGDEFQGYITLRQGMAKSKNSIVVRLARDLGINYIADYLQRFGFNPKDYLATESLVLGTPSFTPLTVARAYAVFDNGGFLINPYLIKSITDKNNKPLYRATPVVACPDCFDIPNNYLETIESVKQEKSDNEKANDSGNYFKLTKLGQFIDPNKPETPVAVKQAPRVLDPNVAWLMNNGLNSNIYGRTDYFTGTGISASFLKRPDIGGKTGTTNDNKSTWFAGYGAGQTAVSYVAFDTNNRELGKLETGSKLPLKVWIEYMRAHLDETPVTMLPMPANIVTRTIDPKSGLLNSNGYLEYYIKGTEPIETIDYMDPSTPALDSIFN